MCLSGIAIFGLDFPRGREVEKKTFSSSFCSTLGTDRCYCRTYPILHVTGGALFSVFSPIARLSSFVTGSIVRPQVKPVVQLA